MEELAVVTGWRFSLALGMLLTLLGLESLFPFKRSVDSKPRRCFINLSIAGSNALILNVFLGGFLISYNRMLSEHRIGLLSRWELPLFWNLLLSVMALDFFTYLWHMAYHRWPWMWRLHRVHHTDLDLDVTSAQRFHPGEMLLSALYRM